jgi:hypothetical protein
MTISKKGTPQQFHKSKKTNRTTTEKNEINLGENIADRKMVSKKSMIKQPSAPEATKEDLKAHEKFLREAQLVVYINFTSMILLLMNVKL